MTVIYCKKVESKLRYEVTRLAKYVILKTTNAAVLYLRFLWLDIK